MSHDRDIQPRADVLYVEDDEAWARLGSRWLSSAGFTVEHADSWASLSRILAECPLPRCILMDLNLGEEDGLALCDRLKASPATQSLPLILFSGRPIEASDWLGHQALHLVAKHQEAKDELVAAIKAAIAQHELSQGFVDDGRLRLDPFELKVRRPDGSEISLAPGPFSALRLLVQSRSKTVDDQLLFAAFSTRVPYKKNLPELTTKQTVRVYVSRLRHQLGKPAGDWIVKKDDGYAYSPDAGPD